MYEMRRWEIPVCILNLQKSYFTDRKKITGSGKKIKFTNGVPQGFVLGPVIWNTVCDGIVNLALSEQIRIVGFADDKE